MYVVVMMMAIMMMDGDACIDYRNDNYGSFDGNSDSSDDHDCTI
jgi:hypothetical protein